VAVVAMPNTDPVVDSASILLSLREAARREARGELFRVDLIARTSERDKAYGTGFGHEQRVRDHPWPCGHRSRLSSRVARVSLRTLFF